MRAPEFFARVCGCNQFNRLLNLSSFINIALQKSGGNKKGDEDGAVEIYSREWPAAIVAQHKATLYTTCGESRRRQPGGSGNGAAGGSNSADAIVAGRTWAGYQTPCFAQVDGGTQPFYLLSISLQALGAPSSSDGKFLVGVSYLGRLGSADNPLLLMGADRDQDNVTDFRIVNEFKFHVEVADECSFTGARNASERADADSRGCAPGQLTDAVDFDRDGVPNRVAAGGDASTPVDRCPQTRSGWRAVVNRNESSPYYGCSLCDIEPARCSGGAVDTSGSDVFGIECSLSAVYEATPSPSTDLIHFRRVTDQSLGFSGGTRVDGDRLLAYLEPDTATASQQGYCFGDRGYPGCPCESRACDSNSPPKWVCDRTVRAGSVIAGVCVKSPSNNDCPDGQRGCACRGSGYCDAASTQCVGGFCVVAGVPFVPVVGDDLGDSIAAGIKEVEVDRSFAKQCALFSDNIDIMPVKEFSGSFSVNAAGLGVFDSHAVVGESASAVSIETFDQRPASQCPQWRLFANDEDSRAVSLFKEASPLAMATSGGGGGGREPQRASPALKFDDVVLVNISRSLGSGKCKYNGVIGVDVFRTLDKAAEISSLGLAGGYKPNQLGFVKNVLDNLGEKDVPEATRPSKKDAASASGIGEPQGSIVLDRGQSRQNTTGNSTVSAASTPAFALTLAAAAVFFAMIN